MTFGELQSQLRIKLREASATFWTDQDIKDAIHEAMDEFADAAEYYERQATIRMLTGRMYYDLTSLLPDTFLSPRRAYNTETSRWLIPTDPRDQDEHTYVQWELTQSTPERYFLRGNWWLGTWPKSNDDVSRKLRFYYTAIPPHMSAEGDEPAFPVEFHPGVIDLALSDLLGQERETDKAIAYWKSGMSYVAALKDYVDARNRIPRMSVL